jgi:tetratricopeptide (TPR) repeat protein
MNAAVELFERGHYPSVVAVCSDALRDEPDDVEIHLLLVRALMALRQDREAHRCLGEVLRRAPSCALAYQMIGELALRGDDLQSAEIYFREALRLDPGNHEARDWLDVVLGLRQPAAAVANFPATTAAASCPSGAAPPPRPARPGWVPGRRRRLARGTTGNEKMDESAYSGVPRTRGFGRYLVEIGVLSPMQLHRALSYHQASGLRIGQATVALGYLSEQKVESAALAYHRSRRSLS